MENTKIEEKSQNKFHLLPKSQQFDMLQRYRDSKYPSTRKPMTAEQAETVERTEELFVSEIVNWNLGTEWMRSINANRP
jgi:hypothetical protein